MCQDMDATHQDLLFYTAVRWLSKGNLLARVFELREEVETFLMSQEKGKRTEAQLSSFNQPAFKLRLAFLADIFEALNVLNKKLQGRETNIVDHTDALKAFIDKIGLWERKLERGQVSHFQRLAEVLGEEEVPVELAQQIKEHLASLKKEFNRYFSSEFEGAEEIQMTLARNPFRCEVESLPDDIQEELLELKNSTVTKEEFQLLGLSDFWAKMLPVFPNTAKFALKVLIPFSSTYLCESGFSTLLIIKSKVRNRLNPESDMRCSLSITSPRISDLVSQKQSQPSH